MITHPVCCYFGVCLLFPNISAKTFDAHVLFLIACLEGLALSCDMECDVASGVCVNNISVSSFVRTAIMQYRISDSLIHTFEVKGDTE